MREREVEGRLRDLVEARGGRCVKFVPDQMPGMPDRIVMLPDGVLVWVETKKPKGGKLDKLQLLRHRQLEELGQRVVVVWTKEQAEELVQALACREPHE